MLKLDVEEEKKYESCTLYLGTIPFQFAFVRHHPGITALLSLFVVI